MPGTSPTLGKSVSSSGQAHRRAPRSVAPPPARERPRRPGHQSRRRGDRRAGPVASGQSPSASTGRYQQDAAGTIGTHGDMVRFHRAAQRVASLRHLRAHGQPARRQHRQVRPTIAATRLASAPAALTTAATGIVWPPASVTEETRPASLPMATTSRSGPVRTRPPALRTASTRRRVIAGASTQASPGEPGDRRLGIGDCQPRFEIGQDDPRRQHLRRVAPRLEPLHILPQRGGSRGVVETR